MRKSSHLIGLCGAGMSAVAYLLKERGDVVTGADEGFYPPVSDYLTKIGQECLVGYKAENLPEDPDLIVIGKNAKLVPETNPEVAAAFAQHKDKIRSFPEVLADLTADRQRTVIAGSYGKSTLTSLITHCLVQAGKAPGYFIGAIPNDLEHSSSLGGDGPFVFEGDEYPSANWDDRPKFVHYQPHTVVLTSATHDHVNIYPTIEDYHRPFTDLLQGLQDRSGTLVGCIDEHHAARFFHEYMGPKISYGLQPGCNFSAANIVLGDPLTETPTRFDLCAGAEILANMATSQMGRHAVQNICGAAAYLLGQNILTQEELRQGVATFSGLARRLDRKAKTSALPIYEGFGSSYEKARAAIDAMKAHFPDRRLVAMFEPHTFTWRNKDALSQYDTAFEGTQTVWLYAPPTQGADTHAQASLEDIHTRLSAAHPDVRTFGKGATNDILETLDPQTDVLLILSSGSFDGTLSGFLAAAPGRYPAKSNA